MAESQVKSISLPTGTYNLPEPRASVRRLVNCFAENAPTDSSMDPKAKDPPVILRRSPGVSVFSNIVINVNAALNPLQPQNYSVRGMCFMSGVLYAVVNDQFGSVDINGTFSVLHGAIILGTGRVHMAGNGYCLVMIIPGTSIGYYWTVGRGPIQITASTFLTFGALNVGFIDSYIVFLQADGRGFYNDDGQASSGTGPITFNNFGQFPREYGTDPFVGMAILNRVVWMFGQLTSEAYIDVGNTAGSPFASAPNNFMELGCASGESVVKQNQTIFWIANDLTVRSIGASSGITPTRVSNHAIEAILQENVVSDAYGLAFSIGGHPMVVFTLPTAGRTLVFDCVTALWHEMSSYGLGIWRPFCTAVGYGHQLVGDSQTNTIGYLDPSVYTEYGNPMIATWIHQPVYGEHLRLRHRRLELILGTGQSPLTGQGSNPLITMQMSDDGGHTWRAMPTKSLGGQGQWLTRAVWWNLGMSRERVYQFNLSDPVALWLTDATLDVMPL